MRCQASWLIGRSGDQPWPGGDWMHCGNEATRTQIVPISAEVMSLLHLCEAHDELWTSAGQLARIVTAPTIVVS